MQWITTMSVFKKKIEINELFGMLIVYGFKFFENEFDSMMAVVDEKRVLSSIDKERLKELSGALVVVNLIVGKDVHLRNNITHDDFSEKIGKVYIKYLEEVKQLDRPQIDRQVSQVAELIESWNTLSDAQLKGKVLEQEKSSLYTINSADDMEKFSLCYTFAELYSSENEKNIPAFKLAKYFVKNDMMGEFLKEFEVVFN